MLQFITMTYLIVGNNKENILRVLKPLLKNLWEREITKEEIFDKNNPDIHILNGQEVNSIGIEEIKKLQKEMVFSPFKERSQIAYILNAEKLTIQAQNSLLKTLEDTSASTAYILITENEKSLLPTILSRCFKLYTNINVVEKGDKKYIDILDMNIVDAFQKIENISKEKIETDLLLRELQQHFQNILEENLKEKNDIIWIERSIKEISIAQKRVKANGNKRLVLENLFLHLVK